MRKRLQRFWAIIVAVWNAHEIVVEIEPVRTLRLKAQLRTAELQLLETACAAFPGFDREAVDGTEGDLQRIARLARAVDNYRIHRERVATYTAALEHAGPRHVL